MIAYPYLGCVTLAFRTIRGIGPRGVAGVGAGLLLPVEPETGLVFRAVDDEGDPDRLPSVARIEARNADVAIAVDAPAVVELLHDAGRIAQVEHWQSPHLPIGVAGMRVVGELDVHGPTLVQAILNLSRDLLVCEV